MKEPRDEGTTVKLLYVDPRRSRMTLQEALEHYLYLLTQSRDFNAEVLALNDHSSELEGEGGDIAFVFRHREPSKETPPG